MRDRRHHPANTEYQELLPSVEQAVRAHRRSARRYPADRARRLQCNAQLLDRVIGSFDPDRRDSYRAHAGCRSFAVFHDIAAIGDEIEVRGPLGGHFLWPEPAIDPVLLIGEAPASCR